MAERQSTIKLVANANPAAGRELAAELLAAFGGIRGLAKKIRSDYKKAKPGSMIRRCITNDLIQLLRLMADEESETPIDEIPTEELERELEERMAKLKVG